LLDYALSRRTRFSENLLRQGLLPSKQLLTARAMPAPERAARELKLERGAKVLMVETLDEANDAPLAWPPLITRRCALRACRRCWPRACAAPTS
jgi:GntR family phosphonate transport system transcriptional regulator